MCISKGVTVTNSQLFDGKHDGPIDTSNAEPSKENAGVYGIQPKPIKKKRSKRRKKYKVKEDEEDEENEDQSESDQ